MRSNHGFFGTRQYHIWDNMISRCYRTSNKAYHNYGGRGIGVTEEWRTFVGFWKDMEKGYAKNLTLDRRNNEGNYTLDNCRWATYVQQNRNRRDTLFVLYQGEKISLAELCENIGINYKITWQRIFRYKWPLAKAIIY